MCGMRIKQTNAMPVEKHSVTGINDAFNVLTKHFFTNKALWIARNHYIWIFLEFFQLGFSVSFSLENNKRPQLRAVIYCSKNYSAVFGSFSGELLSLNLLLTTSGINFFGYKYVGRWYFLKIDYFGARIVLFQLIITLSKLIYFKLQILGFNLCHAGLSRNNDTSLQKA